MNIEQWGSDGGNEAVEMATEPELERDYSGKSLRINGESIAETVFREFGVKPKDSVAVQAAVRAEKDTMRKSQLSNLYRMWQESEEGKSTPDEE